MEGCHNICRTVWTSTPMRPPCLGPSLARLDMTFSSEEAYLDFWKAHPAFTDPGAWDEGVERYVRWDLGGEAPDLRPRVSRAAATADFRDISRPGRPRLPPGAAHRCCCCGRHVDC